MPPGPCRQVRDARSVPPGPGRRVQAAGSRLPGPLGVREGAVTSVPCRTCLRDMPPGDVPPGDVPPGVCSRGHAAGARYMPPGLCLRGRPPKPCRRGRPAWSVPSGLFCQVHFVRLFWVLFGSVVGILGYQVGLTHHLLGRFNLPNSPKIVCFCGLK